MSKVILIETSLIAEQFSQKNVRCLIDKPKDSPLKESYLNFSDSILPAGFDIAKDKPILKISITLDIEKIPVPEPAPIVSPEPIEPLPSPEPIEPLPSPEPIEPLPSPEPGVPPVDAPGVVLDPDPNDVIE